MLPQVKRPHMTYHPQEPAFDSTPVATATTNDLDLNLVRTHVEAATRQLRYAGGASDPLEFLQEQEGLVRIDGQDVPTVAAILCFGKSPQKFLRHAVTKLAHYPADDVISTSVQHMATYEGRVADQIRTVIAYLDSHIERGFVLGEGGMRRERPQFPPPAYRELTVNAVAHRDYQLTGSAIRITYLRSKLEWVSPGSLPPNVTLDNILDMQYSRNPTLARFLYQAGFVEEFGQGLNTVFNLMREQELPDPELRDIGSAFIVSIQGHLPLSMWTEQMTALPLHHQTIMRYALQNGSVNLQQATALLHDRGDRSVQNDLRKLSEMGLLEKVGAARATAYVPKRPRLDLFS